MESPDSMAGEDESCPECGEELIVPSKEEAEADGPVPTAQTVLLIIGIVTAAISEIIAMAYPVSLEARIRGYTFGAYVVACIIKLLVYAVVLGGIAMIVGKLAGKWKTVSYAVFAWLFLFAGLLALGTSIYAAHVANEVHELLRSHPELVP